MSVKGPAIRPGRIPVPQLLLVCQHAQAAVARQAEALEGRRSLHRGPKIGKVQQECTLELISLREGSAVLSFDQAKDQQSLPHYSGTASNLGEEAIVTVGNALRALATGNDEVDIDPGVLESLSSLGDMLDNGVRTIDWRVPRRHGRPALNAKIDKKVRVRIAQRLQQPSTRPLTIDGVLEMVDFKPGDYRCRLHPPVGQPILCTFTEAVEDDVYSNVRKPVRLEGDAKQDPHTERIEMLEIRRVTPLDALRVNAGSFFAGATFEQFARDQAVDPLRDSKALEGLWRDDDDVDAFVADVYRHRA